MGRKYTDAQKRATIRYLAEQTDSLQLRLPKGTKARWMQKAKDAGLSLTRLITNLMEAYQPPDKEEPPASP